MNPPAGQISHSLQLRIRYSETDQMGTFYNSRVLEWFECARTELLRAAGIPYSEMERRGILLPLIESHVQYLGRARYDDLLNLAVTASFSGKARLHFAITITHAQTSQPVAAGHTIHAITDPAGKPTRPPAWLVDVFTPRPTTAKHCHGSPR